MASESSNETEQRATGMPGIIPLFSLFVLHRGEAELGLGNCKC
jgi:hypothetical protein